ncbi:hypothetical protein [Skermania piniformis]|uniref:Head-to-tail adaptor n=1 Tax=Skermania pinensis TaxID=39122 RepID=A0ABX8SBL2_9ACTN|nr:hypothetical protein [Skermania piniformis]QXQ14846.1 hypothetical protein KV203_05545 [Skermania piniformis]
MTSPDALLVTETDVAAFVDEDDDTYQQQRIAEVVAAVRTYCGWHIAPARTETLVVDGPGGPVLQLPTLHVTAVESVTELGKPLTASAGYSWSARGSLRRQPRGTWWTDEYRAIEVRLTHGHPVAPADIVGVVMDRALTAAASPAGQPAEKMGPFEFGGSAGTAAAFLDSQYAILDRYRLEPPP